MIPRNPITVRGYFDREYVVRLFERGGAHSPLWVRDAHVRQAIGDRSTHARRHTLPVQVVSPPRDGDGGTIEFLALPLVEHRSYDGTYYTVDPRWTDEEDAPGNPLIAALAQAADPGPPLANGPRMHVRHYRRLRAKFQAMCPPPYERTRWQWEDTGFGGRNFDPCGGRTEVELEWPGGTRSKGVAVCSKDDNYCRKTGREIALARALEGERQ